jgi:hypothetical protein
VLKGDAPEEPEFGLTIGLTVTFAAGPGEDATVGAPEHATIPAVTQPARQKSANRFMRIQLIEAFSARYRDVS